jgi:glutamate N-acetyltransferase/amino-acid N-acetyltransferase
LANAVILNSGNANAANGEKGMKHAKDMARFVAAELGVQEDTVLVCSTGLIGIPLDTTPIRLGVKDLVTGLSSDQDGANRSARAIMTTDTVPKTASHLGMGFSIGSIAKGAAMIAPNMATMLSVITTDAKLTTELAQSALSRAVEVSFNRLVIDGCTSTNDTVILLSSGLGVEPRSSVFTDALEGVCRSLADQMALDAEGAHKLVRIRVFGALDEEHALTLAKKAASSQLVQCSFYGSDPYWGRIASEFGSAGVDFDLDRLSVSYGGIEVASGGISIEFDAKALEQIMAKREIVIDCDLGLGAGSATVTTTDLSPEYIAENMRTS